jgi:hypothetical protein
MKFRNAPRDPSVRHFTSISEAALVRVAVPGMRLYSELISQLRLPCPRGARKWADCCRTLRSAVGLRRLAVSVCQRPRTLQNFLARYWAHSPHPVHDFPQSQSPPPRDAVNTGVLVGWAEREVLSNTSWLSGDMRELSLMDIIAISISYRDYSYGLATVKCCCFSKPVRLSVGAYRLPLAKPDDSFSASFARIQYLMRDQLIRGLGFLPCIMWGLILTLIDISLHIGKL